MEHDENPWVPWNLVAAVVAFVYGSVAAVVSHYAVQVVDHGDGRRHLLHPDSGPLWLQGLFFSSWWEGIALLLIAAAVAGSVLSLIVIRRGVDDGLGQTVAALILASGALVVGRAVAFGLIGVVASLVLYGIFGDLLGSKRPAVGSPTLAPWDRIAPPPVEAWERPQGWARTLAIVALGGSAIGPALAIASFAGPWAGIPVSIVALVFGVVALRRVRDTGEAGRDWAVGAITVASVFLGLIAAMFILAMVVNALFADMWGGG